MELVDVFDEDLEDLSRHELTDDVLLAIFRILAEGHGPEAQAASPQAAGKHFVWFRRVLPLVCRRWSALLGRGGKYPWDSVVVSVESEVARRWKQDTAPGTAPTSQGGSALSLPGTSPTFASFMMHFARSSVGPLATMRGASVVSWTESRAGAMRHLLLDFGSTSHDFSGHALEALLRAANRGTRGLRTLRLMGAAGVGGQDSYEMFTRLRGLAELHVSGLPQGFLAGTLPYLSSLSGLTRLSFTPEAFQSPVAVPSLPTNLRALSLSQVWISKLPSIATAARQLTALELRGCCLVDGVLGALSGAPQLALLRLDGSGITTPTGERLGWELRSERLSACPALRCVSLVQCSLRELPVAALLRLAPGLELLDLSKNPELGGAAGVPDAAAAAASAACLPPELSQLTALAEVRMAGCGLTAVPTALLRCPSITSLDLSSNSLSALPLPLPPGQAPAARPAHPGASSGASAAATGASLPSSVLVGFAERLVSLNIASNRFTLWPQGLLSCRNLRELVLGAPLLARAAEGELERCVGALTGLRRLEARGSNFEPRAVRSLLAVQRMAAAAGRPEVAVAGA